MKIAWDLSSVERNVNTILTIGTFDGVHRGHQFVLEELKKRSKRHGAQTTAVTFSPHPQLVLQSRNRPALKILTTIDEKVKQLAALGLDQIVVIEFTTAFANTDSIDFVRQDLFGKIGFCEIVIGHDHAFGKDRRGDIRTLRDLAQELRFEVSELPPFDIDGKIVSSSLIRTLLTEGKIKEANNYLGRAYSFSGTVVEGDKRGQKLGYPTANILPNSHDKLIPGDGVYAVYVELETERFKGMMNIGMRPTFDSANHTAEVHIFDFQRTIYGATLRIEFVEKIRNEFKFRNPDEFVNRLEEDKRFSLDIL